MPNSPRTSRNIGNRCTESSWIGFIVYVNIVALKNRVWIQLNDLCDALASKITDFEALNLASTKYEIQDWESMA
ncbi:hypothetical protein N7495_009219 [Penicillium taxi]|uniref:uncharacterized protein n=1 Tax=Penicillium taxi TaxID=168475 RepID=UPI002544E882|nr:uncharacterized protein N7495_009219 [Penicillium taxi]KAJ5884709.1 hypothetical protein N7495_009219 [Penicillium taxi]